MPWRLSYGVKFYIPDPANLKEDYTRLVNVCVREGGGVVCVGDIGILLVPQHPQEIRKHTRWGCLFPRSVV